MAELEEVLLGIDGGLSFELIGASQCCKTSYPFNRSVDTYGLHRNSMNYAREIRPNNVNASAYCSL